MLRPIQAAAARLASRPILAAWLALAACSSAVADAPRGANVEADLAQYRSLAARLEGAREVFERRGAADVRLAGPMVYFWETRGGDLPRLHGYDARTKKRIDYTFPIHQPFGSGPRTDRVNFAASAELVASMNTDVGASLYAADAPGTLLAQVTLPTPPAGERWLAYTVDERSLFVAVPRDEGLTLQRFSPGDAAPHDVLSLDALIAPNRFEEFLGFEIGGTTLVINDHGRFWMAETTGGKAKWVLNRTQIAALSFDAAGAVYAESGGEIYRYDRRRHQRESLTERITKSSFAVNRTFAQSHLPAKGGPTFCVSGTRLVYTGSDGLFVYDWERDVVTPLLLDPRREDGGGIRYVEPVCTEGTPVYVRGIETGPGAASEPPIYVVPIP